MIISLAVCNLASAQFGDPFAGILGGFGQAQMAAPIGVPGGLLAIRGPLLIDPSSLVAAAPGPMVGPAPFAQAQGFPGYGQAQGFMPGFPGFPAMMDEAQAQSQRRSAGNANTQSGIQQYGSGNSNLQGNIQQINRRFQSQPFQTQTLDGSQAQTQSALSNLFQQPFAQKQSELSGQIQNAQGSIAGLLGGLQSQMAGLQQQGNQMQGIGGQQQGNQMQGAVGQQQGNQMQGVGSQQQGNQMQGVGSQQQGNQMQGVGGQQQGEQIQGGDFILPPPMLDEIQQQVGSEY